MDWMLIRDCFLASETAPGGQSELRETFLFASVAFARFATYVNSSSGRRPARGAPRGRYYSIPVILTAYADTGNRRGLAARARVEPFTLKSRQVVLIDVLLGRHLAEIARARRARRAWPDA